MLNVERVHDDTLGTADDEWFPPLLKWDRSVMKINVDRQVIVDNIKSNIKRFVPQHVPHPEQSSHIAIVGGGWSLNDTLAELRELYFQGVKLIALNGSAKWLVEHNLKPSMQVILDARQENAEFVIDVHGCKYFLASQTHPAVFDACEGKDTYIFHAMTDGSDIERGILDEHYDKRWHPVPSAGTVGMVAIMLCRELGFRFQHLFGMDSCYSPSLEHHAYPQALNDQEGYRAFICAGRSFVCSAAQASQAYTFRDVIRHNQHGIQLSVHGNGLLAHILRTGAELQEKAA